VREREREKEMKERERAHTSERYTGEQHSSISQNIWSFSRRNSNKKDARQGEERK
jgi:hypothetical protein